MRFIWVGKILKLISKKYKSITVHGVEYSIKKGGDPVTCCSMSERRGRETSWSQKGGCLIAPV